MQIIKSIHSNKGLTLIEIAIVLIVLGILIGLGASLIGPLTKRIKLNETRDTVRQAKEAILGFAVKNGYLPADLDSAGSRKLDAWGRELKYYTASELGSGDICGKNITSMQVYECVNTDCSVYLVKSNIAFVVYSTGDDANGECTGSSSPFYVREQGMPYITPCIYNPASPQFYYDDVVGYASLDEMRSLRGCPQPLTIISPATLPEGEEDSFYSYSLQAIGGKPPYTWTGSAGSGLTLNESGLISGTINVNTSSNTGELLVCSGSVNINATVNDSAGSPPQSLSFTVPVRPQPLKIITESLPSGYEGSPYTATVYAHGGTTPYSWNMSVSPNCPSGLTCSGNTISGTPVSAAGTYTVTVTVTDQCGRSTTKAFGLTIHSSGGGGGCPAMSLSPPSGTSWTATVGQPFSQSITVSGGQTPLTNTQCTPSSCRGLSLSCSSSGATISGTPASSGACIFSVAWQDSCSPPQTVSGTYTVNISANAPTCTLSASPGLVPYNTSTTLNWTISNGPADATFSPQSGTCTSFPNSTGGSCTTANLSAPPCRQTFTLTVSNANGSSQCTTTVYPGMSEYRVWNDAGTRRDYRVDGVCRRVNNNSEITTQTYRLNPGENIIQYQSSNTTCTTQIDTLSYNEALEVDSYYGNCDGILNFSGSDR